MISTLPLPPTPKVQIWIRGQEKNDTFFIDRKEKKKKGRSEGGKKERRERKEEGGEERRKERNKEAKKECKCVFRLKKQLVLYPPLPPLKVQIWIRGQEKNDTYFIDRKEEKGEERRRKERKEEKKECKCVFRLKK